MEFKIFAKRIRSKPRITRQDAWKKRVVVENWYVWKDLVAMSFKTSGGTTFIQPVAVSYDFYLSTKRRIDIDNLIKGINDALNGLAWPDDAVKYLRQIDYAKVHYLKSGLDEMAKINIRILDDKNYCDCDVKHSLDIRVKYSAGKMDKMIHQRCGRDLSPRDMARFEKHFKEHRHIK